MAEMHAAGPVHRRLPALRRIAAERRRQDALRRRFLEQRRDELMEAVVRDTLYGGARSRRR